MKLAIFDCNSKGTFEIHAADCADCKKVKAHTGLNFTVEEHATQLSVSKSVWGDMINEGSMTAEEGTAELEFKPCCAKLPYQ